MVPIADGDYRAAWIVPVTSAPIANGWLEVRDGVVTGLKPFRSELASASCIDLGEVALLPGLINAHTHLEFSDLRSPIGTPGLPLHEWIGQVIKHRQASADGAASGTAPGSSETRSQAIELGLRESAEHGVALLGEIATIGSNSQSWKAACDNSLPAVTAFLEVLGLTVDRAAMCWDWAENTFSELSTAANDRLVKVQPGFSPHAPYSVPFELLQRVVMKAASTRAIVAMHLAESPEEIELLEAGTGPFRELIERFTPGGSGGCPYPGGLDTILNLLSQTSRCLLVHANFLSDQQIESIASVPHFSVVYCPRTHHFFRHASHPVSRLLRKGVRVCLGTDSRASNPDLSIWREAQFLRNLREDLDPRDILSMITSHAALALGRPDFGQLAVGYPARLVQVQLSSKPQNTNQLYDCLFEGQLNLMR